MKGNSPHSEDKYLQISTLSNFAITYESTIADDKKNSTLYHHLKNPSNDLSPICSDLTAEDILNYIQLLNKKNIHMLIRDGDKIIVLGVLLCSVRTRIWENKLIFERNFKSLESLDGLR